MTLTDIEQHYRTSLPPLYRRLHEAGMLDWMGGYGDPLPENIDWVKDIYPKLHDNPPALFHTGGDLLMMTPRQIVAYEMPEEWDIQRYTIVPFARGSEENVFAFVRERDSDEEPMVALLWEDDTEGQIIAKNFEDFLFRTMVEAAAEFDREQTDSEYRGADDPAEAYRADILRDLETIRPWLRPEYVADLEELYHGRTGSTLVSYYFEGSRPAETILEERIAFPRLNEEIEVG